VIAKQDGAEAIYRRVWACRAAFSFSGEEILPLQFVQDLPSQNDTRKELRMTTIEEVPMTREKRAH